MHCLKIQQYQNEMAPFFLLFSLLVLTNVLATPTTVRDGEDSDSYRLPAIYKVNKYTLSLTVPKEAFTAKSSKYNGNVKIEFAVTKETDSVSLHAHHDFITLDNVKVRDTDLDPKQYSVDNVTDILTISLGDSMEPFKVNRDYVIDIDFTGRLNTEDMYGFYKSSYVDKDNATKYLATTQFEPTHARKAYPCFDEPSYKAVFDVCITHPKDLSVLFNTKATKTTKVDDASTNTCFEETKQQSTYLLAFIISDFTCTAGKAVDKVDFKVCSRSETEDTRNLAVEIGSQVIEKLNAYTGVNYKDSNSKMDQVAIPDFSAGAMENWGLVTYREAALLWDETESSNRYKQRIVTVIAHEFAHQWFGDLVTCDWWSEIFLNEGFATYFEYYIANEVFDNWELDKQFLIEEVHSALEADALLNSQALQTKASTPSEISERFGTISYNKGGSILRMVASVLGLDTFKAGLKKYLTNKAYSSAVPEDLWENLQPETKEGETDILPDKLTTVMENWVKHSGYPLLTVKADGQKITVSQERFLLSGSDQTSKWYVPISYTASDDKDKFKSTSAQVWLTPKKDVTFEVSKDSKWVILNNQQSGYFRVNYDDSLWDSIISALNEDSYGGIVDLNRAHIVDDAFSLARAGKIQYEHLFHILMFLSKEKSYYSWYAAFNGYDFILQRVGQTKLGDAIKASVLEQMKEFYDSVPITKLKNDDQIYTHSQVLASDWACKLGEKACVDSATTIFNEYKKSGTRPDSNLRSVVYCSALRSSTDAADWEFLWNAYLSADTLPTEQVTILKALGCSKDANILNTYLLKTITDSEIRPQDTLSAYSSVYSGNPEGVAVAYDFLKKNHAQIAEKYQSFNALGNLIKGIADKFTTDSQINDLEQFIATDGLDDDFKTSANEALETARSNVEWLKQHEKSLKEYYKVSAVSRTGASFVVIFMLILISKIFFY